MVSLLQINIPSILMGYLTEFKNKFLYTILDFKPMSKASKKSSVTT